MSRWLVGSSRISRSASVTSAAASATRRRSPPDRLSTKVSRPDVAQAQAVQHGPDRRVRRPVVVGAVIIAGSRATLAEIAEGDVAHRAARCQFGLLGHHGDPGTAAGRDPAGFGFPDAGQHRQQRRLPGPVESENADAVAGLDAERDLLQQIAVADDDRDRLQVHQICHRCVSSPIMSCAFVVRPACGLVLGQPRARHRPVDHPDRAADAEAGDPCGDVGGVVGIRHSIATVGPDPLTRQLSAPSAAPA